MTEPILICHCRQAGHINPAESEALYNALNDAGKKVTQIDDLCGMAVKDRDALKTMIDDDTVIVACHARAVHWLLKRAGVQTSADRTVFNLRSGTLAEAAQTLGLGQVEATAADTPKTQPEWPPWYPVIDYDRCINCRQCASFCLFGVYSIDPNGRVVVDQPDACKNLCPACSRICPEAAIIFPKLDEEPYNGAPIDDEIQLKARIQSNVDQMLGDDIYAALAERRKKAKRRLLKTEAAKQGEAERERCMNIHGKGSA